MSVTAFLSRKVKTLQSWVIRDVIEEHKHLILDEMTHRLKDLPSSPYQEFLLLTEFGRHRLATWVDLIIGALDGDDERFLEDQEEAGYQRAIQGFQMAHVSLAYHVFLESCLAVTKEMLPSDRLDGSRVIEELGRLTKLCFRGNSAVAASFLRTREELISEKVAVLQNLLDFTRQVITSIEIQPIVDLVADHMSSVFDTSVFVTVHRRGHTYLSHSDGPANIDPMVTTAVKRSWEDVSLYFFDENGNRCADVDRFRTKRLVTAPIGAQGRVHGALALVNWDTGMDFTHKELDLLLQFVYILAMALENAFMVQEIEQSHGELRLLTGKLITIKEEQRKVLAADIHDTVAQALAGIGYKIQYCSEMARTKPDLVNAELEILTQAVNKAIKQCREVISNLRPDLIDTIGMVPALRKLFENYTRETGIKVSALLPEVMDVPGDKSICLYRVAQEALRNVLRHSGSETVRVSLTDNEGMAVMEVSDDGKGFDFSAQPPWIKDPAKVGLLYMRQRIESVGGTILVETSPNKGCSLTVRIPLKNQEDILEEDQGYDR